MAQVDSETLQVHYYYYTSGGIPPLANSNCVCVPVPQGVNYDFSMAVKDQDGNIQIVTNQEALNERVRADVRLHRNALLSQCDWTQLPDVPLTAEQKAQWATYRQALRDLPNQSDSVDVEWPTPPQ